MSRDTEACIRSWQDRSRKHGGQLLAADDESCERLQRRLLEHRDRFIETHPEFAVFKLEFSELAAEPDHVIRELVVFLCIEPTEDEHASAIVHVTPDLRKHA